MEVFESYAEYTISNILEKCNQCTFLQHCITPVSFLGGIVIIPIIVFVFYDSRVMRHRPTDARTTKYSWDSWSKWRKLTVSWILKCCRSLVQLEQICEVDMMERFEGQQHKFVFGTIEERVWWLESIFCLVILQWVAMTDTVTIIAFANLIAICDTL